MMRLGSSRYKDTYDLMYFCSESSWSTGLTSLACISLAVDQRKTCSNDF